MFYLIKFLTIWCISLVLTMVWNVINHGIMMFVLKKSPFINKNMLKNSTFLETLNILCETLNIFVKVIVNLILFTFLQHNLVTNIIQDYGCIWKIMPFEWLHSWTNILCCTLLVHKLVSESLGGHIAYVLRKRWTSFPTIYYKVVYWHVFTTKIWE